MIWPNIWYASSPASTVDLYSGDLNGSLTTEVQVDFTKSRSNQFILGKGWAPNPSLHLKKIGVLEKWLRSRVRFFDSPFLAFAAFQKNKHFKVPKQNDVITQQNDKKKQTKSDLVPQPSAFINIARTDHTWCPWTVPLPLLWSVPVVRPAVLRGPRVERNWLKDG